MELAGTNQLGVAAVVVVAILPQVFVMTGRPVPRGAPETTLELPWVWPAATSLVVAGALAGLVGSPLLAVSGPMLGSVTCRELARHRSRTRRRAHMLETSLFVDELAASVRAGRSLATSVLVACHRVERCCDDGKRAGNNRDATDVVWQQVRARIDAGRSLREAMDDVFRAEQNSSSDERLIACTIVALDTTGSAALEALERAGDALRERASSREDARTQAQQAFSSAAVLSALPAVFGVAAALAEPDLAALYTQDWIGALCVVVAAGFTVGGWEWLQRLLEGQR